MSHHPKAEAAVRTMSGLGVRAVRLLYTDLHGVARGKDIPIGHFGGMCEEGVAFCAAVMGTDLHHTPVVGGEVGYVDFAIRPDLFMSLSEFGARTVLHLRGSPFLSSQSG